MILAFASAAHGHNTFSKGYIVAASALLYGAIGWAAIGLWGWPLAALVVAWWLVLRRSRQENIELQAIEHDYPALRNKVLKAHYYTGWLTCASLAFFNYETEEGKRLGWEDQWIKQGHIRGKSFEIYHVGDDLNKPRIKPEYMPFWDCRRPTEFATGLTGDILLLFTLIAL